MELRAKRPAAPLALALALLVALVAAPAASAQKLAFPPSQTKPPAFHRQSAVRVIAIANGIKKIQSEQRKYHDALKPIAYEKGTSQWQVSYFQGKKERAQVLIDDASGAVLEAWVGPAVAWRMARGYPGAFAGKLNAPYVWLPLCALFAIPFVSVRRWRRLIHLDIAVLLAFGISHIFFNKAEIWVSVPAAYPVLAYLFVRLLWEGFRPRRDRGPLLPHIPWTWLALALVFLVGFRIALNVVDSGVIDVGYAGVIGADKIEHGRGLYNGNSFAPDNEHGDTYGPVNYLLYVPFEQAFPWSGHWDDLPAAHAAALTFDLLTIMGLFLLGRRLRAGPAGTELGVVLAYAWAAFPYTLFTLDSNSNDTIVAMFLVYALLFLRSPPARGVFVGLGAAAKFVPLALAPLFATATGERRWRNGAVAVVAVVCVCLLAFSPFVPHEGLRHLYDRTLGSQIGRSSPFSIWGEHPGLKPLWTAVKVLVAGLAVLVAFVPARKTPVQVAALGAAVLVALQIALAHWFYLYIVWFAPFALIAFFAPYDGVRRRAPAAAVSLSPGHPLPPRSAPHSATGHPAPSRTSPASG